MSGFCFGGRFLFLRSGDDAVLFAFLLFLFERHSSGLTGPHVGLIPFFLFVPAAFVFSPVLAVRPFFSRFVGMPFRAAGVFGFSWYIANLGGLISLAPSEPLSRTRGGMGVCG